MTHPKRIPYGSADYGRLRRENCYYVDKTRFIPLVEAAPFYLFFIRPRRFGKTLWLSVMEHYYDVGYTEQFEALFGETYIGQNPTADRNSYLVLMLNFAEVDPRIQNVEASFESYGRQMLDDFLNRYADFFSEAERQTVLNQPSLTTSLRQLFLHTANKQLKVYLLIDEYDNFANTILTTEGQEAYHTLTHGGGFFRHFFNLLKGATSGRGAGLSRLFITGVSPITLDDVTSGFNIGHNITLSPQFNEMVGFTEAEVQQILEAYPSPVPIALALSLMSEWYNHYRFFKNASNSMYNSDMVWYFILRTTEEQGVPQNLIDENIRIDYNKLRHLILVDQQLNGNFSLLKEVIELGELASPINPSFPVEHLLRRENFVSLLYYFGLLSFGGTHRGEPLLKIPNLTVKELMYGYIRSAYQDVDIFRLEVWKLGRLVGSMAYDGQWQAVFEFLTEQIREQTSIRDYLNGEKVIQGFLLAYLNVTNHFLLWSEKEMGGGFADIYLEPFIARNPDMKYGYLLELKYIPRHTFNQETLQQKIEQAESQLQRYLADSRLAEIAQTVTIKGLALIYNGWELVYQAEVNSPAIQ